MPKKIKIRLIKNKSTKHNNEDISKDNIKNNNKINSENIENNECNNKLNINIHPNLNEYLLNDIKYIKSTTIKEILKTLNLDSAVFKKLESHLNKTIIIN